MRGRRREQEWVTVLFVLFVYNVENFIIKGVFSEHGGSHRAHTQSRVTVGRRQWHTRECKTTFSISERNNNS